MCCVCMGVRMLTFDDAIFGTQKKGHKAHNHNNESNSDCYAHRVIITIIKTRIEIQFRVNVACTFILRVKCTQVF